MIHYIEGVFAGIMVASDGRDEESESGDSVPDYTVYSRNPKYSVEGERFLERVRVAICSDSFLVLTADEKGSCGKNLDFMSSFGLWDREGQKGLLLGTGLIPYAE